MVHSDFNYTDFRTTYNSDPIMVQNLISNPDLSSIPFDSIKCKLFRDSVENFIQWTTVKLFKDQSPVLST